MRRSGPKRRSVEVILGTPELVLWEPAIRDDLGVPADTALAEELTAALREAHVGIEQRGEHPTFRVATGELSRLRCGRLDADARLLLGGRLLRLVLELDAVNKLLLGLGAAEHRQATLVQVQSTCRLKAVLERPAPSLPVVRFGTATLAARDAAIASVLGGAESATAWLSEFLTAHGITVDGTGQRWTWWLRNDLTDAIYVHDGLQVEVARSISSMLDLTIHTGSRTEARIRLLARGGGGADIIHESFAHGRHGRTMLGEPKENL